MTASTAETMHPSTDGVQPDDILSTAQALRWQISGDFHEKIVEAAYAEAAAIADSVVTHRGVPAPALTAPSTASSPAASASHDPVFTLVSITIAGANLPSLACHAPSRLGHRAQTASGRTACPATRRPAGRGMYLTTAWWSA